MGLAPGGHTESTANLLHARVPISILQIVSAKFDRPAMTAGWDGQRAVSLLPQL